MTDTGGIQKRRAGRPSTGKRGTFTFRVTNELRSCLEDRALASGRPVSEEIEMILEKVLFPIKVDL